MAQCMCLFKRSVVDDMVGCTCIRCGYLPNTEVFYSISSYSIFNQRRWDLISIYFPLSGSSAILTAICSNPSWPDYLKLKQYWCGIFFCSHFIINLYWIFNLVFYLGIITLLNICKIWFVCVCLGLIHTILIVDLPFLYLQRK